MSKDSPLPFEALDDTFRLLTTGPRPLSLDLEGIGGGLPSRVMALDQLKNRLLHPSISHAARNQAVRRLVTLAQTLGPDYVVGLAGVLLPGLKRAAAPLIEACPELLEDLQAEMLVGLLEALAEVPPGAERVASRLIWAAARHARRYLCTELAHRTRREPDVTPRQPARPGGHPDQALISAVADRFITAEEAELIGESRVAEVPLEQVAADLGVAYNTAQKRRRRAEIALIWWLSEKTLSAKGPKPRFLRVEGDLDRGAIRQARG